MFPSGEEAVVKPEPSPRVLPLFTLGALPPVLFMVLILILLLGQKAQAGPSFDLQTSIDQEGSSNEALIFQQQNRGRMEAAIKQLGEDNIARIEQMAGDEQNALIDQLGSANEAYITILEGLMGRAEIFQEGSFNYASIHSAGSYSSLILQKGDGNTATIDQPDPESRFNTAAIRQYGTMNGLLGADPVRITQQGGHFNTASIIQGSAGDEVVGNLAAIFQDGSQNMALIEQRSSDNEARIYSTGTGNGTIDLSGDGAADPVAIIQELGTGNYGLIQQDGSFNGALIEQSGSDNEAYIFQIGDYNRATVRQTGNGNVARIDQG